MHIISIRTGHLRQPIKVKLSHKKWNILAHNAYYYLGQFIKDVGVVLAF